MDAYAETMFRKRETDVAQAAPNARPAPKPRPAWRRTWTPGIVLLTAIGVGVPGTFAVMGTRMLNDPSVTEWSSRRAASEAKVRALGLPLRFDELPSRESGAAAAMRELGVLAEKSYQRHKTWSPAHEAKIRATFLRAGREESMTYPRKWEEGMVLLYANLGDWKIAAKMAPRTRTARSPPTTVPASPRTSSRSNGWAPSSLRNRANSPF